MRLAAASTDAIAKVPFHAPLHPPAMNDNQSGNIQCPVCHASVDVALSGSEYRGRGLIHNHWHCGDCGHDWVTVLHVSS
ncbi:MAG TPA: hypothetical protein VNR11_18985 [Xanthobacteraceae bacterium]|nr:hypothetical protein [Xanthobacteraceae bacterium]